MICAPPHVDLSRRRVGRPPMMGLSRWGPPPERGVAAAKGGAAAGERVLVTERSRRQRGGAAAGERGRHMEERSTDLVALVAGWMWRRSRRARRGLWCGRMGERAGSHEGERTRGAGEGERAGSHDEKRRKQSNEAALACSRSHMSAPFIRVAGGDRTGRQTDENESCTKKMYTFCSF